jgi:hypothetical protein
LTPTPPRYDLAEILALMKANRVLRVKLGSLEVELSPSAFADQVSAPRAQAAPLPSDEDFLFMSTAIQPEPADKRGE